MKGIIAAFRGSRRRKRHYQMIVYAEKVTTKAAAEKLAGKSVVWTSPGKKPAKITGTITQPHGVKGALRVQFERGLPGQALGQAVEVQA